MKLWTGIRESPLRDEAVDWSTGVTTTRWSSGLEYGIRHNEMKQWSGVREALLTDEAVVWITGGATDR